MKKGIIGNGGFGREIYHSMTKEEQNKTVFFVDDEYYQQNMVNTLPLSKFNENMYEVIIAIGDSKVREGIVKKLPKTTKYFTFVHPSSQIHSEDVEIGEGSVICAGCILTTNIKIGKHSHLNLLTTIGHDNNIGEYFTTAPGSKISGNCSIGNHVYFGTNSSVREKINICNDVVIGLNAGVVKDIKENGVYVGVPVKKIK
jgi:sugar O-acyltransferase (sialic acid O-acetyltransferase NeuD family)